MTHTLAVLVRKYRFSPEELASLTLEQISDIYLCEEDEDGNPVLKPKLAGTPVSWREVCFMLWRKADPSLSDEQLVERFAKECPNYPGD